jgi:hypothetical protein
MAAKKDDATSPAIAAIDPRQVAANDLTSTPDETDVRVGKRPDPKDEPGAPGDVSNVVDPSDAMTLTGTDAAPGPPAEKKKG